jgi:hypothetical protein
MDIKEENMFSSAATTLERALARRSAIENQYPGIAIGKTETDRQKWCSILMAPDHYKEWFSIGEAIPEIKKAL